MSETESKPSEGESRAATPSATPPAPEKPASPEDPTPGVKKVSFAKLGRAKAGMRRYFADRASFWQDLPLLASSIFSEDAPTRRMTLLFLLSLAGLIGVSSYAFYREWSIRHSIQLELETKWKLEQNLISEKQKEDAKFRSSLLTAGIYTMELKPGEPEVKTNAEALNMAEIEIVLLCDNQSTREYIESHTIQLQNLITQSFIPMEREELLSKEGKRKIKVNMIKKLNEWLPEGKVEDIYFSQLLVN